MPTEQDLMLAISAGGKAKIEEKLESRQVVSFSSQTSTCIAYLSSYPPRECGIATFTKDLLNAVDGLSLYKPQIVIALTSISTRDFLEKKWNWSKRHLAFPGLHNKDAVIFPKKVDDKYVMFHRFEPDACIAYSGDLRRWYDLKFAFGPRERSWDS